jgi:hypothetical protein
MSLGTLPVGGKVLAPNSEPIFIGCLILTKIVAYLCRSVIPFLAVIAEKNCATNSAILKPRPQPYWRDIYVLRNIDTWR